MDMLQDERGAWVQFFKKSRAGWVLQDKPFFVCWIDIVKQLQEPNLTALGCRIYYSFLLWEMKVWHSHSVFNILINEGVANVKYVLQMQKLGAVL